MSAALQPHCPGRTEAPSHVIDEVNDSSRFFDIQMMFQSSICLVLLSRPDCSLFFFIFTASSAFLKWTELFSLANQLPLISPWQIFAYISLIIIFITCTVTSFFVIVFLLLIILSPFLWLFNRMSFQIWPLPPALQLPAPYFHLLITIVFLFHRHNFPAFLHSCSACEFLPFAWFFLLD